LRGVYVSIVIAILVFGAIVVVHELGHFIAARKCDVLVEEFAIGMGPMLFRKQVGETLWSLRLFPIGGFCKMLGEDTVSDDTRALNSKKVYQKAIILAAGAFMNFLLAFVIFLATTLANGFSVAQVSSVVKGAPAEQAGLLPGDRIVKLNGTAINIYEDLSFEMSTVKGEPIEVEFKRDGQRMKSLITPYLDESTGAYKIGFIAAQKTGLLGKAAEGFERAGFFETIGRSFALITFFIKATVIGLVRLVTAQVAVSEMSGPIGIMSVIGETYTQTIKESFMTMLMNMLMLCALLSANLGVVNLLPLPALDGGRLVFVLFEGIRRKPVPAEKEGMVHLIGFVLLMILAAFIAFSDIRKLL
jgi:regulator of sigma E protease